MLKIRLRRTGKKNQPSYRVVVVEHTAPIQGSYMESLGTYNPRISEFTVNKDRVLHWLGFGAQPSERVAKLLIKAGVEHKQITLPDYSRKPKKAPKKEPVVKAAAPVAEVATEAATPEEVKPAVEAETTPATEEAASEPTATAKEESTPEPTEESAAPADAGAEASQ